MAVVEVGPELREKLGPEATRSLVDLINSANGELEGRVVRLVEEKFEARVEVLEERFERRLSEEMGKLDIRINQRITELDIRINQRITEETAALRRDIGELRTAMAQTESRLTRWALVFWVGQLIPIIAVLLAVLLKG